MHQNAPVSTIQKNFPGEDPRTPLYGSSLTTWYLLPPALQTTYTPITISIITCNAYNSQTWLVSDVCNYIHLVTVQDISTSNTWLIYGTKLYKYSCRVVPIVMNYIKVIFCGLCIYAPILAVFNCTFVLGRVPTLNTVEFGMHPLLADVIWITWIRACHMQVS